ncbi:MAG TPA: type II toxin-antitoxin system MqsA family antitoxin [Armatimonadota bacterium]|nr:type II toxin-antitoxin system MqsA family antitoxin [Armatimonadota bacterium]
MKCLVCKVGETEPGKATVTLERDGLTMVVKGVPAMVCRNCGEEYVDEETTEHLLKTAEEEASEGAQVDIREYKAA